MVNAHGLLTLRYTVVVVVLILCVAALGADFVLLFPGDDWTVVLSTALDRCIIHNVGEEVGRLGAWATDSWWPC